MMTDQTNRSTTTKIVPCSDRDTTNDDDDFPYELFKQEQEKFQKALGLLPHETTMRAVAAVANEDNDSNNNKDGGGAFLLNQPPAVAITTNQTENGDDVATRTTKMVASNSNSGSPEPEDTFPYELFKQEQEKFMRALSKQMSPPRSSSKSSAPPPNKTNNALLFAEEDRHNDKEVGLESERRIVATATTTTTTNGPTPPTIQNVINRQGKEIKKMQNEIELLKQQMAQIQKALHEKAQQE